MHGKDAIVEEVLDWRPFDYFTVNTLLPIPGASKIMLTHAFQERINGATRIEMRVGKPKPQNKAFVDQAAAKFKEKHHQGDWKLAIDGGRSADFALCHRRADFDCLWRAIPDPASKIKLNDGQQTSSWLRHC